MHCIIKSQGLLKWKKIKNSYKNNKFEIATPIYIGKFKLPDRLYSAPTIQGYFEYVIKRRETFANILQYKYK